MENFLFDAIALLSRRSVDFIICGGVACILQGSNRNSFDLDISLEMSETNLGRFVSVAREMHWIPRAPEPIENLLDPLKRKEWIEVKQARVFTLNAPDGFLQIDVFLDYPIAHWELAREADTFEIDGIEFKVSSIKHLLQAKRLIEDKRKQDRYDIEMLEDILNGRKVR